MDLETVPGGYRSGTDAIQALIEKAAILQSAHDMLARIRHMESSVNNLIIATEGDRKDAVRAIELFSEVMPSSLGVSGLCPMVSETLGSAQAQLSQIEIDVRELLRGAQA